MNINDALRITSPLPADGLAPSRESGRPQLAPDTTAPAVSAVHAAYALLLADWRHRARTCRTAELRRSYLAAIEGLREAAWRLHCAQNEAWSETWRAKDRRAA